MDNEYLENLVSGLTSRIEELEEKINKLDIQLNESQGLKEGLVKQIKKLQDKVSDIDSRIDDLENP
jgi:uncharacterized coiled-coil DUF342 family protein